MGFPTVLWAGTQHDHYGMVMGMLGRNLQQLYLDNNKKFSFRTAFKLAIQMLARIEAVHEQGYIHLGVKPENFVIGVGEEMNVVYIIDFEFSKEYIDDSTQKHITADTWGGRVGNKIFMSMNGLRDNSTFIDPLS